MPSQLRHPPADVAALQLQVTLDGIEPPIWRRLWVEDTITLGRLHEVLQIVMGWQDYHLHQFITGQRFDDQIFYTPPWDDGFGDDAFIARQRDETRVKARTILPLVGDSVTYDYDLGDSWEHTLLLEKVVLVNPMEQWLPWCIDGRRACPPEDVGGTGGYGRFLEATADPSHEDHASQVEWGGDFDPEHFDRKAVNTALWWWAKAARGRHCKLRPDLSDR
ncbi:plasmid pRiA4b ORF-3 family protein [Synechococcus sp. CCY9202]|uniref:plasmid pRiA4b ORF-3 family protein n=1 Tax=Synechococcus sp. CCY9202 TaxID=174698 RepID=UPI002B21A338|nr:plasmid pRiA4b ORF-3 family protein [Synechococcus sp. CCY9202]MEA5422028.1 plasmid pRiA4b ORF-3 family protein [Synechococcus sp. CCY9202]